MHTQKLNPSMLEAFMRKKNYAVKDVAVKLGVTDQTVHNWKNGSTGISLDSLNKLAELIGIDPVRLTERNSSVWYRTISTQIAEISISVDDKLYFNKEGKSLQDRNAVVEKMMEFGERLNYHEKVADTNEEELTEEEEEIISSIESGDLQATPEPQSQEDPSSEE